MMVDKPPYWGDAASCAPGALAALNYVGALATVTVLFPTLQDLRRGRRQQPFATRAAHSFAEADGRGVLGTVTGRLVRGSTRLVQPASMAVSATLAPRRPPPAPAVGAGRIAIAVAGLLLIGAYVSMQHVSARSSPVWDEMQFWGIGYYYWHYGRFNIPGSILHPPHSYYLNSLPLMARTIPPELFHPDIPDLYVADTNRGNHLLYMFGFDTFLASRTPFIVAYCLAGVVVF